MDATGFDTAPPGAALFLSGNRLGTGGRADKTRSFPELLGCGRDRSVARKSVAGLSETPGTPLIFPGSSQRMFFGPGDNPVDDGRGASDKDRFRAASAWEASVCAGEPKIRMSGLAAFSELAFARAS